MNIPNGIKGFLVLLFSILTLYVSYWWLPIFASQITLTISLVIYWMGSIMTVIGIMLLTPIFSLIAEKDIEYIEVMKGAVWWFIGVFYIILMDTIFPTLMTAITGNPINSFSFDTTLEGMLWLGYVLTSIIALIALPMYKITKGLKMLPENA